MTERDLAARYRRLLAVYPWEHRRRYEDEMLAVLLAGARPDQRRPGLGEAVDVIAAGLRARLRHTVRGLADPGWSDAAPVAGLLAAFALFALAVDGLVGYVTPAQFPFGPRVLPGTLDWLQAAGWGVLCVAVLAGLRRVAAVLAWSGVVAGIVLLTTRYGAYPVSVIVGSWQVLIALVVAGALTVAPPGRRALALLGARRLVALGLALVLAEGVFAVSKLTAPSPLADGPTTAYVWPLPSITGSAGGRQLEAGNDLLLYAYLAGLLAAALTVLVALATLAAPVRRRVLVLLAPVVTLVALVRLGLSGWAQSNGYLDHAVYLVPAQWAALVAVPPLTFAAGVVLVRRREHALRMIALGRSVDRE